MNVSQVLKIIGELGYVEVRKDGSIQVTPPAINVHHARMNPFVSFLQDYVRAHPDIRFKGFFTLYDAWREHAEPSQCPEFAMLSQRFLKQFCGTGTLSEGGRFIQPYYLKDLFPVFDRPVLAFGRHNNDPFVQLIPDTDFIQTCGYTQLKTSIDADDCEWRHKQSRLFWRGSMHGFPYCAYDPSHKKSQRALLIETSQRSTFCDAKSSHTYTKKDQLEHKYLIDIDGEVNAWSGLYWKLYSNSVVFKVLSHYEQWYYHLLTPWVHYIPVRGDLSDLEEKYEWAIQHDDDCRRIAQAGREFASSLTYQQVIENIRLSNNTKELFQIYAVSRKLDLLPSQRKPPVIVHTYRPVCHTVNQAPGFGDFLRGTVALFQLSRRYEFKLLIDFTHHPLSGFIQQHDVAPMIGDEKVNEFFNERNQQLEPFLADLIASENIYVITHAVPTEPIDDICRSFICERLQPLAVLQTHLKTLLAELNLEQFCTVHLRMGDHLMAKNADEIPMPVIKWFKNIIVPKWGKNVLVLSDNVGIKDLLQKQFGVALIYSRPVHLGQCVTKVDGGSGVLDTISEFMLMGQSKQIYQYSVYPWGSGFSDMCAQLYGIPIEKITVECTNATRSIQMSPVKTNISSENVKKVLNVGGNSKAIVIPSCFDGWQHDLLDIDPRGNPDVLCDARELWKLPPRQYDAIYCSHNLEHFHRHDVANVLKGFRIVLKKDGFIFVRVPDLQEVMRRVIDEGIDIDDVLYEAACGPILVRDVIYGYHVEIERSGNDFYAHKTGFTAKSLLKILEDSGFTSINISCQNLEISALAFLKPPEKYNTAALIEASYY